MILFPYFIKIYNESRSINPIKVCKTEPQLCIVY